MRLGQEPKGIVGFGKIIGEPTSQPHWDESRPEDTLLYAQLAFQGLQDQPFIPLEELSDRFPAQTWTPQSSATLVRAEYAAEILQGHIAQYHIAGSHTLLEGASRERRVLSYDRNLVARQLCIAEYRWDCFVCGFNFERRYGALGRAYVEVHHLLPLAESVGERVVDPVKDLRPVCANCHRMLHRGPGVLSIEELRQAYNRSVKPTPIFGED